MPKLVKVCATADLPPGHALGFEAEGLRIAVFNAGGSYYGLEDSCTHAGAPLSEGAIEGDKVTCPWHAADFCLKTGAALTAPAFEGVRAFRVVVEGDDVKVEV
jgi:3-phenylpropionate/trans-cinnamate dioxygenase ferredoxin component